MLTIVMYHYVRDLPRTRYPTIKGLRTEDFDGQLDYIEKHYSVCGLADVVAARRGETALPANPCLLTFDDGLIDHYVAVFPRLKARGLPGCFFPVGQCVEEWKLADVHKVQFVLARADDPQRLVRHFFDLLKGYRGEFSLPDDDALYRSHAKATRLDPAEVIFVKRCLQVALPAPVRGGISTALFERYVGVEEHVFARELYMDMAQLRLMAGQGMEIGGHGYRHDWLGMLKPARQQREIELTYAFLGRVLGRAPRDWAMCYPSGSYDGTTLEILRRSDCAVGLTTEVRLADGSDDMLTLPRIDTVDLPVSASAARSPWTEAAGRDLRVPI